MKKSFLSSVSGLVLGSMVVLAGTALAASGTITLSPAERAVEPGQTVVVAVTVNPGEQSVYTAKTKITFPAALLEVQSFTFSDGWLPLTQSGYDVTDNANGVLVKTAGYPGGLSTSKVLGTITFRVKIAGTASVQVAGDSMLLGANNEELFAGSSGSTLTAVQPTPTPTPAATVLVEEVVVEETVSPSVTVSASATPELTSDTLQDEQTAAIAGAGGVLGLPTWAGAVILAVVLGIVSFLVRRVRRRNNSFPTV